MAGVYVICVFVMALRLGYSWRDSRGLALVSVVFGLLIAMGGWLLYNYMIFNNPLNFENGRTRAPPAAAPGGGHAGAGDCPEAGAGPEHCAAGAGGGGAAEVRARPLKGSVVDAVEPQIRGLLAEWPDMPVPVIAERISWQRGLTVLKDRVRELRPLFMPLDPASRTAYRPGELAQCDL